MSNIIDQLSGRVTTEQKIDFNNIEGKTFSDKLEKLLDNYKNYGKKTKISIKKNKTAITNALNVIMNNLNYIDYVVDEFVLDKKLDEYSKINQLYENHQTLLIKNNELESYIQKLERKVLEMNEIKEENRSLLKKYNNLLEKNKSIE